MFDVATKIEKKSCIFIFFFLMTVYNLFMKSLVRLERHLERAGMSEHLIRILLHRSTAEEVFILEP